MRHIIKYLAATALLLTAALPIQAQEDNAAFYIYQNDGHFDGFFYDQVQKISYSKLDTLGVEHEDFVSQEIITNDSTYRIMLTAIDSVSFVQPEIKFNPRLRDMRTDELRRYIAAKEGDKSFVLKLKLSIADKMELIPNVGDVIVDFDTKSGYGGKVKDISVNDDYIVVACDPLESLNDVFYQFITVEQQDKDKNGRLLRRRVAGMPEMSYTDDETSTGGARRAEGDFEGNLFDFSLSGQIPLSFEHDITLNANVGVNTTIKGVYKIPWIGPYYIGLTFQQDVKLGVGIKADAELKKMESTSKFMPSVPIPAAAPIFELTCVPGLFIKGESHIKFEANILERSERVCFQLEFNNSSIPSFNFGHAPIPDIVKPLDEKWNTGLSLEWNGSAHLGLHGPLTLGVNKWLSYIMGADVGTNVYIGPKLSGALNISLSMNEDPFSIYSLLKESNITLTPLCIDYETIAELKFGGQVDSLKLADGSINILDNIKWYPFPEFDFDVEIKDLGPEYAWGFKNLTSTITPSRSIFWPVSVGVGVYDSKEPTKMIASAYCEDYADQPMPKYSQRSKEWELNKSGKSEIKTLQYGKYITRPIFKLGDFEIPATPTKEIIVGTYIEAENDTVFIPYNEGKTEIKIKSNADNLKCWGGREDYVNNFEFQKTGKDEFVYSFDTPELYNLAKGNYFDLYVSPEENWEEWFSGYAKPAHIFCIKQVNPNRVPSSVVCSFEYISYYLVDNPNIRQEITRNDSVIHVVLTDSKNIESEQYNWEVSFDIIIPSREPIYSDINVDYWIENGTYSLHRKQYRIPEDGEKYVSYSVDINGTFGGMEFDEHGLNNYESISSSNGKCHFTYKIGNYNSLTKEMVYNTGEKDDDAGITLFFK